MIGKPSRLAQLEVQAIRQQFTQLQRDTAHIERTPETLAALRRRRARLASRPAHVRAAVAVLLHRPHHDVRSLPVHGAEHWPALWRKALLRRDALTPAEIAVLVALPAHPDWLPAASQRAAP
jgi:hypothetical protein